jgi:hypothetical protein
MDGFIGIGGIKFKMQTGRERIISVGGQLSYRLDCIYTVLSSWSCSIRVSTHRNLMLGSRSYFIYINSPLDAELDAHLVVAKQNPLRMGIKRKRIVAFKMHVLYDYMSPSRTLEIPLSDASKLRTLGSLKSQKTRQGRLKTGSFSRFSCNAAKRDRTANHSAGDHYWLNL